MKLHYNELQRSYFSLNIIRIYQIKNDMGEAFCIRKTNTMCNLPFKKPEGNRPPVRPRHRQEANIKIYFGEIGLKGMDSIHVARNRDH